MDTHDLILDYIQSCISGSLGGSDCGLVWQMLAIAVFLLIAVITLAALRFRSRPQAEKA